MRTGGRAPSRFGKPNETRCLTCREPGVKCLLCGSCWRMAILAPVIGFAIQQAILHFCK